MNEYLLLINETALRTITYFRLVSTYLFYRSIKLHVRLFLHIDFHFSFSLIIENDY